MLGRGGMGVVYQAFDHKRQKLVALKTMQGLEPAALYRFKQEFRSLAGLAHPNLVTLHELVSAGGQWFYTMELIEGVDFLTFVCPPGSPRPPAQDLDAAQLDRLRSTASQLAEGLLALHQAGKLHRDIKPGNVLVTHAGRVVLLDFGLAADLDRSGLHQSTEPHLLGTAAYMAPEQAACLPVSPAGDWYALGVILYEALTGRAPFEGRSLEVLLRKQQEDPPPPADVAPGVSPDLNALCVELLDRDPQQRPLGPEVLRRLGGRPDGAQPAAGPSVAEPLLVGRERHLAALAEVFEAVRLGRTVTMAVAGPSGAGKTVLVQRFLEGLTRRDEAVVLAGRCYEQESVPYKALDSLVDALSSHLARLSPLEAEALLPRDVPALARVFPVLLRVDTVARAPRRGVEVSDAQEVRRRALAALRELLGRMADRRPLVLAIDDLQWGDIDSAALLADLVRPPDPPALLLVVSYRSEDRAISPCLAAFFKAQEPKDAGEHRELAVEPLTLEEGQQLALALLDVADPAREVHARLIARESGGNPFFVSELARYLQAEPEPAAAGADAAGEITLTRVLGGRFLRLPNDARRLLEVVAVAGRPLHFGDACQAAEIAADEEAILGLLRAARLIRGSGLPPGEQIEAYHDRIRETAVARLTADELRHYHRQLARVLEKSGRADPEALALHFREAGERERAGNYAALAAARAAETLAFDRAATLYRLALELHPGAEERWLRTGLGDALANAGRGLEAGRAYLEAAAGAEPAEALELRRRAALQLLSSGHIDEGRAALGTVLAAAGMRLAATPGRALWGLLGRRLQLRLRGLGFRRRDAGQDFDEELRQFDICWSAAVGLSMVDYIQGAYFQTRGLLLALRAGEPVRLARALAMEAAHVSSGGSHSRRRTAHLLQTAEDLARQVEHPYPSALVWLARGIAAALEGRWRDGCTFCDRAEGIFREYCTGVMWELGTAHRFSLWPLMYLGEVAEIGRRLPRLLKEARERDDLYAVTSLSLVVRTFWRLAQNEPERARHELEETMARWSPHGFHVQHMNRLYDEAQIDLYEGRGQLARQRLTDHWAVLKRSHLLRVQQVRIFMLHLRARSALAAAGGPDARSLLDSAERDARLLRREAVPWAEALAGLVQAGVARGRGDVNRAVRLLREAADGCTAAEMHLHAAAAQLFLGKLAAGAEGAELVARAEAWMAGQGIRDPEKMAALLVPGIGGK
jgi:hypothetical protein